MRPPIKILQIVILFFGISLSSWGQTEIYRESFTNTTNLSTTTGVFSGGDNSGDCSTSTDVFNTDLCTRWSGAVADGGDQSFFYAQDIDAVSTATCTKDLIVDMGTIPGGNTGEIIFYGLFGSQLPATSAGYDASDSVRVSISVNGGSTYSAKFLLSKAGTDRLQISDGTTTDVLGTAYTKRSVSLGSGLNGQNIKVKLVFYNLCTGAEAAAIDEFSLTHTPVTDDESIIEENGFDEPDNIAYASYSAATGLTTINSIKVGSFVIKDGGSDNTDNDSYSTILNSVDFDILNFNYIKALAIFESGTNIAEQTTVLSTTSFTGLTLTAADEGTKSFDLYATFNSTVTDNSQIQFTISNTTSSASGSNFLTTDAGGAQTSIAGDDNRLEVTATKLVVTGASWSDINTDFDLTVQSTDDNNNIDLDNNASISLSLSAGPGSISSVTGLTQNLSSGTYNWTDIQGTTAGTITIQAAGGGLIAGSTNVDLVSPTVYYVDDNSNTNDIYTPSGTGNDATADGTNPATPYLTLGAALAVASANDIIYVDAGTYSDHDLINSKAKTRIIGAGTELTLFSRTGADNDFMLINANDIVLQDMSILNYNDVAKGYQAIKVNGKTGIRINKVKVNGSGYDSSVPILVTANSEVIFSGGGSSCNIGSNLGGGIEITGSPVSVLIEDYVFVGNQSASGTYGSGLRCVSGSATQDIVVRNSRFESCDHTEFGGAIYLAGGDLKVYDCIFDDNDGNGTSEIIYGTSISLQGGTALFTRCKIMNASSSNSTSYGGGMAVFGNTNNLSVTIDSCTFSGNSASSASDIYIQESGFSASLSIFNSTFSSGGTNIVRDASGTVSISNCGSPVTSGAITIVNTTSPSYTANPVCAEYTGTCGTGIIFLPVELVDFSAKVENGSTLLNWATSSEENNDYFIVEKSTNTLEFEYLTKVNGAGTSNEYHHYSAIDFNPVPGLNYYRLKQVDYNGEFSYSKIVKVNITETNEHTVSSYYDRESGKLNIFTEQSDFSNMTLMVSDMLGRTIYSNQVNIVPGENLFSVDLHIASGGVYNVVLYNDSEMYSTKTIVIK